MRLVNLEGQKIGRLTVLKRAENKGKRVAWLCRCDCGKLVTKTSLDLSRTEVPSCGCHRAELTSSIFLTVNPGDKFDRLTVLRRASDIGVKPVIWECQCQCGNITFVPTDRLKMKKTVSCGCYHSEAASLRAMTHGMSNTRLYGIWSSMKRRCYTKGSPSYKFYGARGTKICDAWKSDFMSFYDWAFENGYDPDAKRGDCTIDRIDPFGDYCPENCRWVSMAVQLHNKRADHIAS